MDEIRKQGYNKLFKQILPVLVVVIVSYCQAVANGIKKYADNFLFVGVIIGLTYGIYKVKKDRQWTLIMLLHSRGIRLSIFLLFLTLIGFIYYNINFFKSL